MGVGNPPKRPLLLGVDAGGSKTHAWLASLQRHRHRCQTSDAPDQSHPQLEIMGIGSSGPANVRSVGVPQAAGVIAAAIRGALRDSKLRATDVDAIWVGAAGAANRAVAVELRTALEQEMESNRLHVSGDIELVMAAAQAVDCSLENAWRWTNITPASDPDVNCGAVLALPTRQDTSVLAVIAGTGSVVCGRESRAELPVGGLPVGATYIAGGWGPLIGDRGSGLWFGRQVLQAACQHADGTGPPTTLLSRVLEHLKIDNPRAVPEVLQTSTTAIHSIAGMMPLLAEVLDHDEVARNIVDQGAADLARQVIAVFQKLSGPVWDLRVALGGSVLTKTDIVSSRLLAALEPLWTIQPTHAGSDPGMLDSASHRGDVSRPKVIRITHPVYGALVLAAETLAENSTNSMGTSTHWP